jgi:hypothetical protein
MKKIILPLLLVLFIGMKTQAQSNEEDSIIQIIQTMFDGMRAGDSTMVSSTFGEEIQMSTVFRTKKGEHKMIKDNPQKFLNAVGTPHKEIWDERIFSYDVKIDGLLASVWTEYSFYLDDKFSHCGVNVFQFFKNKNGWEITNITDTRRRSDCKETVINELMDNWHKAAATADEDVFFGSMTKDAIYIGTDASERWLRDELKEWSKKFFDRDSAWSFTAKERNITFSEDGQMAWFDELLDTWMGVCRSTGVVVMTEDGWKLKYYHLSMAIPNEVVNDYLKILEESKSKTKKKD